jgi:hypothetical protein
MKIDNEVWKDIEGYEGLYQVSNLGRVKSLKRRAKTKHGFRSVSERILSIHLYGRYLVVGLCKNNKVKTFKVHSLVAMAFLGHVPCGMELVVDHIDENVLNNKLNNLQVITVLENTRRSMKKLYSDTPYITYNKRYKKWLFAIRIKGGGVYVKQFKTEEDAVVALEEVQEKIKKGLFTYKKKKR